MVPNEGAASPVRSAHWEKSEQLLWRPDEPTLTVAQQFRLIEIAHETQHEAVRRSALELLNRAMNPVRTYEPGFQIRDGTAFPGEPLV